MTDKKLYKIGNWLDKNSIPYEFTHFTDGTMVLIAQHDYDGPYPTNNSLRIMEAVRKFVSRFYSDYTTDVRGYKQATYIYKRAIK